jgi:hypothetical protein
MATKEATMPQSEPRLPTDRAFVVRFQAPPPGAPLVWEGRVEHLASYQVARFHSSEELLAFMSRALADAQARQDEEGICLP